MLSGKTKRQKVLTVCLANASRSPTAEWLLSSNYKVKSCGVAETANKYCVRKDIDWADKIVVMEPYQKKALAKRFPRAEHKIVMIDVPEVGKYCCEPSLIKEIRGRLVEHGFRPRAIVNMDKDRMQCHRFTENIWKRKVQGQVNYPLVDYNWDYIPKELDVGNDKMEDLYKALDDYTQRIQKAFDEEKGKL